MFRLTKSLGSIVISNPSIKQDELLIQLKKQLGFVSRSCASFDVGFKDEAIRIAVSIRVLVYDTKNSISLLTHLGAKNIFLRTSCPPIDENTIMLINGLSCTKMTVKFGQSMEAEYEPILDSFKRQPTFVPTDAWWNQTVYRISEGDVARRHIVLGAANKDGGAHVDPQLTREYEALCRGVANIGYSTPHETIEHPIPNSHLADLRQMGHELLNSPDLLSLANS